MPSAAQIVAALSHQEFRSGAVLAGLFGVSRTTVSNAVRRLRERGIAIDIVPGRGYRLRHPVEFLAVDDLTRDLADYGMPGIGVEVFESLESTNSYLLERARQGIRGPILCVAERQTRGKGRRGRRWESPYGANLYLSILWELERGSSELSGLSLVAGMGVVRALARIGVTGCGLKWPNDVYWRDRKLGGLLVEVVGETEGPVRLVVGVGLNLWMSRLNRLPRLDQPWTDLADVLEGEVPSRNRLAAAIAVELAKLLDRFGREGFSSFADEWPAHDVSVDRAVTVHGTHGNVQGVGRGIDRSGRILVEHGGQVSAFSSGEVSLRLVAS